MSVVSHSDEQPSLKSQDVTVIRHDKKIDLRVTPVEARMRS
jgi:hypothetical protein